MEEKECRKCSQVKAMCEFYLHKAMADGHLFLGSVDLLILWDGYGPSGLRLHNGVVTEHEVVMALGKETRK